MANYQRCKIRVYPNSGVINPENLKEKVARLREDNLIHESIWIYYPEGLEYAEIRFTAKRYPYMLTEIFSLETNDLWVIQSDEGGSSDVIRFETRNEKSFWGFTEKSIYVFDEMRVTGDSQWIRENMEEIFGFGLRYMHRAPEENGQEWKFQLKCLYTANSFFYSGKTGEISLQSFEEEETGHLQNGSGEFWDMLFHTDGIEFKERFYQTAHRAATGTNPFPLLERV